MLAEPHDARVLRPLGRVPARRCRPEPEEGARAPAADSRAPTATCSTETSRRLFVQSETIRRRLAHGPSSRPRFCIHRLRSGRIAWTTTSRYLFAVSRFTPLKRDVADRGGAGAARGGGHRAVLAGEGEERARHSSAHRGARVSSERVSCTGRLSESRTRRSPRALPRGRVPAVRRRLRVRDGGGVRVGAAGDHVSRQRWPGRDRRRRRSRPGGGADAPTPSRRRSGVLIDDRDRRRAHGPAGAAFAARLTWPATVTRLLFL